MGKETKQETGRNSIYSLDNVDYCLRKAIAIQVIRKRLRSEDDTSGKKPTEQELADAIGVTQPQVSRWIAKPEIDASGIDKTDENKRAPSFEQILRSANYFRLSLYEVITEAVENDEKANDAYRMLYGVALDEAKALADRLVDNVRTDSAFKYEYKDTEHFERIRKLENAAYLGFYLRKNGRIGHFIMETAAVLKTASVPALMRVEGGEENPYRCNVVSPVNQKHLYIYLRQDSDQNDRGMMIFHVGYGSRIRGKFVCGSGLLLSSSSGEVQTQWVVILRVNESDMPYGVSNLREWNAAGSLRYWSKMADTLREFDRAFVRAEEVKKADGLIGPILTQSLPEEENHAVQYTDLKQRQDDIYQGLYKNELQRIDLAAAWERALEKVRS